MLFAVTELLICVIIGKLKESKRPKDTESSKPDLDSSSANI